MTMWKLLTGQDDPMNWGYAPLLLLVGALMLYFTVKIRERRKIYFPKKKKKRTTPLD